MLAGPTTAAAGTGLGHGPGRAGSGNREVAGGRRRRTVLPLRAAPAAGPAVLGDGEVAEADGEGEVEGLGVVEPKGGEEDLRKFIKAHVCEPHCAIQAAMVSGLIGGPLSRLALLVETGGG